MSEHSATLDDRITALMVESLETGLSRLRERPVRVREIERDPGARSSSFRTERLRVSTDEDAEPLSVYFKDLNPEHQVTRSWTLRRADREPSRRELDVYESVLSYHEFGTPRLYGSRWEPGHGRFWIFIEDLGLRMLQSERIVGPWVDACRWAARFHSATSDLSAHRTASLPAYDARYFRQCAERVEALLPGLDAEDREIVRRGLEYFTPRIDWLDTWPRCVVHGQLFGKNVMLRPPPTDQPVAVIDWETAALAPGVFDLASISSGKWTAEQRQAMRSAYLDEYRTRTGEPITAEEFERVFLATAVFHALDWLVWWSQHPEPSRRFPTFVRELRTLLEAA